jgi:cytochrome c
LFAIAAQFLRRGATRTGLTNIKTTECERLLIQTGGRLAPKPGESNMSRKILDFLWFGTLAAGVLTASALMMPGVAYAADDAAAEALAKKSKCMTCHSVDKKKDGPSFKETAAKYKGKADAEKKLTEHLMSSPKIKVDGKEEIHESPKTKSEAEVKNLVAWILSR